ncbi:hypothetical protein [Flavobacterium sp.]|uniref:hypothetical protein n=1 Tax=Flavobacterium sp. TaxID=239 RepID=UPI0039E65713
MSTPLQPITDERQIKLLQELQHFPNIFSQLQVEGKNNERTTVKVHVAGYCGLVYLVMDILKAALLALESDQLPSSVEIRDPNSNIASLIDLAIQLMPLEEIELLDILYQHHLQRKKTLKNGLENS